MKTWKDHTDLIRRAIEALEDEGYLSGSLDAFLAHAGMVDHLDKLDKALKQRDTIR